MDWVLNLACEVELEVRHSVLHPDVYEMSDDELLVYFIGKVP